MYSLGPPKMPFEKTFNLNLAFWEFCHEKMPVFGTFLVQILKNGQKSTFETPITQVNLTEKCMRNMKITSLTSLGHPERL